MTEVENANVSNKEMNFRAQEQKYERLLQEERAERERLQRELESRNNQVEEEETSDPYVDHKRLNKTLAKHGQVTKSEIEKAMIYAKQSAKEELKQEMWLENNSDFHDIMKLAEKFAQKAPQLADTILKMPEGFERQKLVYNNIKALGIHEPEQKTSSIQDKIDANRQSPYYQPSGVGATPYSNQSDYSPSGQKAAYDKMQELKGRLRL